MKLIELLKIINPIHDIVVFDCKMRCFKCNENLYYKPKDFIKNNAEWLDSEISSVASDATGKTNIIINDEQKIIEVGNIYEFKKPRPVVVVQIINKAIIVSDEKRRLYVAYEQELTLCD